MKKGNKLLSLVLAILMLGGSLTACQAKTKGVEVNKNYNETGMANIGSENFDYESGDLDKRLGLGYAFTEVEKELNKKGQLEGNFLPGVGYIFTFISEKGLDLIKEMNTRSVDEKKSMPDLSKDFLDYASLYKSPKNEEKRNEILKIMDKGYKNKEKLWEDKDYDYYFAWNENFDLKEMDEADQERLKKLLDNREKFMNASCIFLAESEKPSMKALDTIDLSGEKFTSEDFKNYDITMVNIWTTWCTGCISHMPSLEKVYQALPNNMNMISICANGNQEGDLAREIIAKTKVKFKNIIPDKGTEDNIIKYLDAYPTTIFVDRDGNIIGQPLLGGLEEKNGDIASSYISHMKNILAGIKE